MTNYEPVLQFIEGIDPEEPLQYVSNSDIADMIKVNGTSKGDWFTQWLVKTPEAQRQRSLRSLLTQVFPQQYFIFAVADGLPIKYDQQNEKNPFNSVSRNMRFLCAILPDSTPGSASIDDAISQRTIFAVAGNAPDSEGKDTTPGDFLQCVSWDPNAHGRAKGMARFFQRNIEGWMFFGDSTKAFDARTRNLGVFDGHIGGALIMKELQRPWTHWYDGGNTSDFVISLGSTQQKGSLCDPHNVLYDPLFTPPGGIAFGSLSSAEQLEQIVEKAIPSWYKSRFQIDFTDPNTNAPFTTIGSQIGSWVGHILQSRAMNIATSRSATGVTQMDYIQNIPATLFFNAFSLQTVLPSVGPSKMYTVKNSENLYVNTMSKLGTSLYYWDKDTQALKIAVPGIEGPFAFPVIEPGAEDYLAVQALTSARSNIKLLPNNAVAAMLMVDFCNPIYSARREDLMQYLPESATVTKTTVGTKDTYIYNILEQFEANIRASEAAADPTSPEFEFLQLLDQTSDPHYVDNFTKRVNDYLERVASRLDAESQTLKQGAIDDYALLAEGRRRIYRSREDSKPDGSGLDEFTLTLPMAENFDSLGYTKMAEDGHTVPMTKHETGLYLKKARLPRLRCPYHVRRA